MVVKTQGHLQAIQAVLSGIRPESRRIHFRRIGGYTDGGYLVPRDLFGISDCFSPGAENRKSFEDELAEKYSIRTHIVDFSSDRESFSTPWLDGMQTFNKKWLGSKPGANTVTMDEWVNLVNPDMDQDWLLQIDVEGGEYEIVPSISSTIMRKFRYIVLELHDLDQILTDSGAARVAQLMGVLTKDHTVAHVRPNNCCGNFDLEGFSVSLPRVAELTLVRSDLMQLIKPRKFDLNPHPREILWNKKYKKPLHFDSRLLASRRCIWGILRIVFDHIGFFLRALPNRETRISIAGLLRNLARSLSWREEYVGAVLAKVK